MRMKIGNFDFAKEKTFIIAELSANHNGDLEIAKKTIRAAKETGADAIKLQTYTADTMTLNSTKDDFVIKVGHCGMVILIIIFTKGHIHYGSGMKSFLKSQRKRILSVFHLLLIKVRLIF